ncbi:hypothetical protein CLAIMM_13008 [Cladophialophora immunda]|nr:hypothetical protein CLAIMM_13008 [Cladophialophora immunda]
MHLYTNSKRGGLIDVTVLSIVPCQNQRAQAKGTQLCDGQIPVRSRAVVAGARIFFDFGDWGTGMVMVIVRQMLHATKPVIMTSTRRSYSRPTLRKILKAHSKKKVGTDVDPLVYLNYILFIDELMQTATRKARLENNKTVTAKDIRKVTITTLRRFKG